MTHVAAHAARVGIGSRCAAVLTALAFLAGATAAAPTTTLAFGGDGLRDAINAYRTQANLAPVAGTALLDDIATARANQLVRLNRLEHDIDYVTTRLNSAGVCWRGVGEILAWEKGWSEYDYSRTARAWYDSPTHHDIMLGADYNAAGGAWKSGPDIQHYSVMVFVVLCGGAATTQQHVSYLQLAQRFETDRPLVMTAGTHTGFRLAADGTVLGRKIVRLGRKVAVTAAGRSRVGGARWLKASSGPLSGYWVREGPYQYVRGTTELLSYAEPRAIGVQAGRYRGYRFNWLGTPTDWHARRYWHDRTEHIIARAIINGRWCVQFASGWLGRHWVQDTADIRLR